MKKLLSIAIAALLAVTLTTPALAHGHHRGKRTVRYSTCSTRSCTQTGLHVHNGRTYNAHYYGDGHKYHEYCELEDCTVSGYHSHDGTYCFGHTANDGHNYHHTGGGHH